jgi:ribosomal protein S18 acetylase RimI-like enzyme
VITIRNADINDCKELGIIHCESWKVAYRGIVPDSILDDMSAEKSEKRFYNSFIQGLGENVIILNDSQIVGFMCLGKCRDEDVDSSFGEIWGIYLLPSFWGQGIGTMLIQRGINELRSRGYSKISLWVLEENMNARRFYEKSGFVHDGTVKEINIGKPLNEYRYVKDIS